MEKIKKYQCLYCDGTGKLDKPYGFPVLVPDNCYGCYGRGWITGEIFKIQMRYSKKSNLELVELYEKAKAV